MRLTRALLLALTLVTAVGGAAASARVQSDAASGPGAPAQPEPRVVLSLMPATQSADPGQTVDVRVEIKSAVPVRSMQLTLRFDPAVLQATGFDAGTYFSSWADANGAQALVFPNPPPFDNVTGKAGVVSINILGSAAGGPSGNGLFGTFHLKVKPGTLGQHSNITLDDVVVGDAELNQIPDVGLNPGMVQVGTAVVTPTQPVTSTPTATIPTAATPTSTSGAPQVVLSVMPATQSAEPGQTVDVRVEINTSVQVRSLQLTLRFNPAVLQATGFDAGPFFSSWAEANGAQALVFPNPPPFDNVMGKAGVVSINILGAAAGGPSGAGLFGTFHLTVKPGTVGQQSNLTLEDVVVGDAELNEVKPITLNDGVVTVGSAVETPTATPTSPPNSVTPTKTPTVKVTPTPGGPKHFIYLPLLAKNRNIRLR